MDALAEAIRNYAVFHRMPMDRVCTERMVRSFGGIEGWARLSTAKVPPCLPQLHGALMDASFPAQLLCSMAQRNHCALIQKQGGDARPSDSTLSVEYQLKWSLPSFSLAKEAYEVFRCLPPGKARLREVLTSSAGALGWEHYSSTLDHELQWEDKEPLEVTSSSEEEDFSDTSCEEDVLGVV